MSCIDAGGGGCVKEQMPDSGFDSLEDLVNIFKKRYSLDNDGSIRYSYNAYKENGITGLIEAAVLSKYLHSDTEFLHPHQRRIGYKVLEQFYVEKISRIDPVYFTGAKSFDEIYNIIWKEACQSERIGQLATYDIALRIGYCLGKYPDKVYLHQGAKEGARLLLKWEGKRLTGRFMRKEEFPEALQQLECHDIEVFLCVSKKDIDKLYGQITPN